MFLNVMLATECTKVNFDFNTATS